MTSRIFNYFSTIFGGFAADGAAAAAADGAAAAGAAAADNAGAALARSMEKTLESLLDLDELTLLNTMIDRNGYLTSKKKIAAILGLDRDSADDRSFDPISLMQVDAFLKEPVFVLGQGVLWESDLAARYDFARFGKTPAEVFTQLEILITPELRAFPDTDAVRITENSIFSYNPDNQSRRDAVETVFGRSWLTAKNASYRFVKTKIFVAGDTWEKFQTLAKIEGSLAAFFPHLSIMPPGSAPPAIAAPPPRWGDDIPPESEDAPKIRGLLDLCEPTF